MIFKFLLFALELEIVIEYNITHITDSRVCYARYVKRVGEYYTDVIRYVFRRCLLFDLHLINCISFEILQLRFLIKLS